MQALNDSALLIDNILVFDLLGANRYSYKIWDLGGQSRPCFRGRSVPWRGAVPFFLDYLPSSPVSARARAQSPVGEISGVGSKSLAHPPHRR